MSTSQTPKTKVVEIADVQNKPDIRHIAIDKVGIKDIRHPVLVKDRSQGVQHTIANFNNMYVELPHNFKGTHMSRFVEILNSHDMEISAAGIVGCSGETDSQGDHTMNAKKTKAPALDIGISGGERTKIVKGLAALLADSYTLCT